MQLPTMYDVVPMIVKPATAKTKGGDAGKLCLKKRNDRGKHTKKITGIFEESCNQVIKGYFCFNGPT